MQTNQIQSTPSGFKWEVIPPTNNFTNATASAEVCSSAQTRGFTINKAHFENEEKENLQITSYLNPAALENTTKSRQQPIQNLPDANELFDPSLLFPATPPQTFLTNLGNNVSIRDSAPEFPRQTSLNVVFEVLGPTPDAGPILEGFYPPTPSPSDNQDEHNLQHPSPCRMAAVATRHRATSEMQADLSQFHFPTSDLRIRAHSADQSQDADKKAVFYFYEETADPDDANEGDAESSTNTENCDDSKSTETSCASSNTATTSSAQLDDAPPLQSLSSFIIKSIDNTVESESMDVDGILQDFLDSTNSPQKSQAEDVVRSKLLVEADHCYSAKRITITDTPVASAPSADEAPLSPNTTALVVSTSTTGSTPKMVRTPSYIKRRTENNRACRESRRKRKAEREEAEEKLKFFLKDNEEQKEKIKQLEADVKKTRALLLSRMTKQD